MACRRVVALRVSWVMDHQPIALDWMQATASGQRVLGDGQTCRWPHKGVGWGCRMWAGLPQSVGQYECAAGVQGVGVGCGREMHRHPQARRIHGQAGFEGLRLSLLCFRAPLLLPTDQRVPTSGDFTGHMMQMAFTASPNCM